MLSINHRSTAPGHRPATRRPQNEQAPDRLTKAEFHPSHDHQQGKLLRSLALGGVVALGAVAGLTGCSAPSQEPAQSTTVEQQQPTADHITMSTRAVNEAIEAARPLA